MFLGSTFFIILTVDSEEDDRKRREEGYDMHKGSMLKLNLRCWISLSPGPFGYQSTPCFKFFTIMVLMRHKFPVETGRTHLKTQGKNLGHTTEGASEGEAGVMWNLPASILHIRRIHREHMLERKNHKQS